MSAPIERYVLHLSLPADVPARSGPVTLTWPGESPVEAGVLGAYFVEPEVFMAEQEAAPDLLSALRACEENLRLIHGAAGPIPRDAPMPSHSTFGAWEAARAAIAKATGQAVSA